MPIDYPRWFVDSAKLALSSSERFASGLLHKSHLQNRFRTCAQQASNGTNEGKCSPRKSSSGSPSRNPGRVVWQFLLLFLLSSPKHTLTELLARQAATPTTRNAFVAVNPGSEVEFALLENVFKWQHVSTTQHAPHGLFLNRCFCFFASPRRSDRNVL